MEKKLVRLTESDLHRIVENSVKKIINELDWKTYYNLYKARSSEGDELAALRAINTAQDAYNRDIVKPNHPTSSSSRACKNKYGEDCKMYGKINLSRSVETPIFKVHAGPNDEEGLEWDSNSDTTNETGYIFTGGRAYNYRNPQLPDDYFGDNEDARKDWERMKGEFEDYNNGKYEYKNGKGWKVK